MANKRIKLSEEQKIFITKAKEGNNILVDACIGSGKTTAIQYLCDECPEKKILYLTYNKLLKIDAKGKIKNKNVTVTNYHGYAYMILKKSKISCGISEVIDRFNQEKPAIPKYDLLIIDEYQDIESEFSVLLEHIKAKNPRMQIVAVGDMMQKIYDKTALNVPDFINGFLGIHLDLVFTQCFRLPEEYASKLGRIWKKTIVGVNNNCKIVEMSIDEVVPFLAGQNPEDILCLGKRNGVATNVLNELETQYPDKFNKKTVYASIAGDTDLNRAGVGKKAAIFTTYDSSKGLERKICVVFDYTEDYWLNRLKYPDQSYEILRNIFCVAASRGKQRIIFVKSGAVFLTEEALSKDVARDDDLRNVLIDDAFDHKYHEDIEECYSRLKIKQINTKNNSVIDIKGHDELIDLTPCIDLYQKALFFDDYCMEETIVQCSSKKNTKWLSREQLEKKSLEEQVLFVVALQTGQERYETQVSIPFINENEKQQLRQRIASVLRKKEIVQARGSITFWNEDGTEFLRAHTNVDVVREDRIYSLKYVLELTHAHFLQCACSMIALGKDKGILWNTRDNCRYEISVPDKKEFLDSVAKTITKRKCVAYYSDVYGDFRKYQDCCNAKGYRYHAVIDTETNDRNEVISVGAVIFNAETGAIAQEKYYIITPACTYPAMYSYCLKMPDVKVTKRCSEKEALINLKAVFKTYGVKDIFAYNANFDYNHLPELSQYYWYDIMKIAAYKQFNSYLPDSGNYHKTGRLKSGYGVEAIYRLISGNSSYVESHNAVLDAKDEYAIMQMLHQNLYMYQENACINQINFDESGILKRKDINGLHSNSDWLNQHFYVQKGHEKCGSISETFQELLKKKQSHVKEDYEKKPERPDLLQIQEHKTSNNVKQEKNRIEKIYTVANISQIYGIDKRQLYKEIHGKILKAEKRGNRYEIKQSDLESYLELKRKQREEAVAMIKCFAIGVGVIMVLFLCVLCVTK